MAPKGAGLLKVKWIRVFWHQKARFKKVGSGWGTGSKISGMINVIAVEAATAIKVVMALETAMAVETVEGV